MSAEDEKTSRSSSRATTGLKILLCGMSLMLLGIAIAARPEFQNADRDGSSSLPVNSIIARIPIVVGAVLALLGGTRMSMGVHPLPRTLFGVGLFIGSVVVPILITHLHPDWGARAWPTTALMPFFVFAILGLIFISTGLLRAFPGDKG